MRWLVAAVFLSTTVWAEPRLLMNKTKAEELRRLMRIEGSAHQQMLRQMQAQLAEAAQAAGGNANYERAYRATSAAFLFQLTGEISYCEAAHELLRAVYADQDPESTLPERGYGLARATVGSGFAFAYDWCKEAWKAEERQWAEARLRAGLDAWLTFRHANVEAPHKGSNWVSVCRAGELLEMIALGLEKERSSRYATIKADLKRHMENMDELGVTQEGIGYTGYGGIFLLRALLALRSIGDGELEAEASRHAWWKQAMYAGAFADAGGRVWLMSGVSHRGIGDEGWASLLFAFTPRDHLAHYKWWYERHMGQLSPAPDRRRFDYRREGLVWAMLYYPAGVAEQDPTEVLPKAVSGSAGLTFFRNRWRDSGDILISFHADATWHSHAWDQPEALSWRAYAYGSMFAGGPEKTRVPQNFTTVLVDGVHAAPGAKGTKGSLRAFEPKPDGGEVIAASGNQFASMGVEVERRFSVAFLPGNRARLRIHDTAKTEAPHRYTFQINVGDHRSNDGVSTPGGFLLQGERGIVRGRVLRPQNARVSPGDPLRIDVESAALDMEVEMEFAPEPQRKVAALPGGLEMAFVAIPAGSFLMGSPDSETGRDADEGPQHRVNITRNFWMGVHEVTQEQWQSVMGANPATFQQPGAGDAARRPVETVTWQDALKFIARLNFLGPGRFRLPTEAEWEYAARAGTDGPFPWTAAGQPDRVHQHAWANSRSFATTHPVGQKPPNAWGLHDMHGNVWEWCSDWYGPYSADPATDPGGPASGTARVFRGGSWYDFPVSLRSANRHRHKPDEAYPAIGLRLVWEPPALEERSIVLPGGVPMRFARIPAGEFLMGSPASEAARQADEGPQRKVILSRPFWMGTFEVTQAQWQAVMGRNPSTFKQSSEGGPLPVEMVSWNDAMEFIDRINGLGSGRFRLPTEAEWEYAARAGSMARYSFGDDPDYRNLPKSAWFYSRAEGRSHPAGTKAPNAWGLHDMHGNVWEWCSDWFGPYGTEAERDPGGPAVGKNKVIRGGSWFNEPEALRSANRNSHVPESRQTNLGLRLVMEAP